MTRLFLFAIVSHFAYNFAFGIPFIPFQTSVFNQTSVIWPLAWGLVALNLLDIPDEKLPHGKKVWCIIGISILTFCADWSSIAVLAIIQIGCNRGDFKRQMKGMVSYVVAYAMVYFLFVNKIYGMLQMFVALSIPFLHAYNGERGKWKGMKWFFYAYYPLHLVICGLIRIWLHGNVGVMIGG